jgi:DNA-binding CsgD family transcriptional regulator
MDLVSRVGELAACRDALAASQGRATAALVTGPPGIGKTSLWRAAAAEWAARPGAGRPGAGVVLRTAGVPGGETALASLADLLDPVTDTAVRALPAPLGNALLAAVGQVSPQAPVTDVLLERAIVRLLRGLAEADGLLLAVDDEQWLDEDSRRLLATAAVRLADAPVRWLVAVRAARADNSADNAADAGLARVLAHELGPGAVRVDLAGLGDDALADLVRSRFPGEWSVGVLRQVVALAAGNPYAGLEIARETVARGERAGTVARVPPSLDAAVRRRLERLGPPALAVVQAAALVAAPTRGLLRAVASGPVAGSPVDGSPVTGSPVTGSPVDGSPADRSPVDAHVSAALDAGVLVSAPPGPVLRFGHPLLREAAGSMLSDSRRRELHRLIGAALDDPHEAAWHLACAAEEPDEALALRLEEALKDSAVRGAPARAAMLARAAVQLTADPESLDGWRRRLEWLVALIGANEFGQVRRQSEQWTAEVPAPLRGALDLVRSRVAADSEEHYELLTATVGDLAGPAPWIVALAYAEASVVCGIILGRLDQGRRFAAAAVPLARATGYQPLIRGVLGADALLAALAGEEGARERLRAAVAEPGFAESPLPFETPETALAAWHAWRGETAAARDLMRPVAELADQLGVAGCRFNAQVGLAAIEHLAGDLTAAREHADAAARVHREFGVGTEGPLSFVLAAARAARGDVAEARTLAERGLRAAEAVRDWQAAANCRWVLGQAELSVDDPGAALRWLDPISDMLQASGIADPGCYPFTPDLIEAWAATGRLDAAAERLKWLQEAARRLDHPWGRIASGRAAAVLLLARRDPAAAVAAVAPVIGDARDLGLALEAGRCLLVLGTAQRKARRRREAAETLDAAVAAFRDLGAARWQELAVAQRSRLAAGRDGDSLTTTERRVAELVTAGHSNPEIAATLFISVKTVEANLTRIYRKLGLRGRVDLARHDLG